MPRLGSGMSLVGRVMAKLGAISRTEAAAMAHARGLLPAERPAGVR